MAGSVRSVASERAALTPEIQHDGRRSSYRWTILALLFFATTINYIDRQVLGILAPTLQRELGWSETDYGAIVSWFSLAYGIGMIGMGRLLDRIGTRKGFALAIVAWSLAAMGHAAAKTAAGFSIARGFLGLGESGNFPAAVKTVSEWFPKAERALAVGIFNAGSNVGAVVAPLTVPWIALTWGWRAAFIATGAVGFVWLAFWLAIYREPAAHPKVSPAELAHIRSDSTDPIERIPWLQLLRYRQTWAFLIGKSLTDPVWLFYLFWLPKFLDNGWGVKLAGLAAPLVVIYVFADVGSVAGGWFSGTLIKRGWTVNRARKTAMLVAALLIVPTLLAPKAPSMWVAVGLVSVAAAAHQWWSANLFTTVSDMFPRNAVGSVVGIGGFGGAIGGVIFQRSTGRILEATHGQYGIIFFICGMAYVGAWVIFQLLVPKLSRVEG
jgi:ACS family hexuronate transporter-like MFS transporter